MRPLIIAAGLASLAAPAWAQDPHAHHHHHAPAAAPAAAAPQAAPQGTPQGAPADPHAHHRAPAAATPPAPASADPHAHHRAAAPAPAPAQPRPAAPGDKMADAIWGEAPMARARAILAKEHGGMRHGYVLVDQLELRPGDGADVFAWSARLRYGGDVDRLMLTTEGEAADGEVEHAEVQALWSRAIGPYFDVQAGLRQDLGERPRRTYATVGVEGLAPYWFDVEGRLFLSSKGDLSARLEGAYDLRLTNRLILQPQAEAEFAATSDRAAGVGSGLSSVEVGMRLRYDLGLREVSPYVGVSYERKFGKTADLARAEGEDRDDARLVVGVRALF